VISGCEVSWRKFTGPKKGRFPEIDDVVFTCFQERRKTGLFVSYDLPYILESNAHPFYSFRGLKNQMRIRFAVESWILEKWYRLCTCRNNTTIQSFIILFITVEAQGGRYVNTTRMGLESAWGWPQLIAMDKQSF
jgi:hypothetical protein